MYCRRLNVLRQAVFAGVSEVTVLNVDGKDRHVRLNSIAAFLSVVSASLNLRLPLARPVIS